MPQQSVLRKVIPIKPVFDLEAKVYPRSISGLFARWRWAFVWLTQIVFYGLCWLPWHGRQAILLDIDKRRLFHPDSRSGAGYLFPVTRGLVGFLGWLRGL